MAERFRRVLDEVTPLNRTEVWADTETGVQYLYHQRGGDSAGLTVLLGPDGKPRLYRPEDGHWAAPDTGAAFPKTRREGTEWNGISMPLSGGAAPTAGTGGCGRHCAWCWRWP